MPRRAIISRRQSRGRAGSVWVLGGSGCPPPRHRQACNGAEQALPPSTKLIVKFAPPLPPPAPATPAPAKVTDKATPPRGRAGEGRECGGGGARGEGAVGGDGAHALCGGPNVSQVFETGIWVFHVGQVRRGGQRAPLPALAWPGPGPCAGVRARTPAPRPPRARGRGALARPAAPGPRAQAARLADVAARGRQEGGRRRAGGLHFAGLGSEGAGAGGSGKPRRVAGDLGEPC